jgi:hypothetical protein
MTSPSENRRKRPFDVREHRKRSRNEASLDGLAARMIELSIRGPGFDFAVAFCRHLRDSRGCQRLRGLEHEPALT